MADEIAVYPIPDTVDAHMRAFIERVNAARMPPFDSFSPADLRKLFIDTAAENNFDPVAVGAVEDMSVAADGRAIGVRLYRPADTSGPVPLLFFAHGGGFVIGNLDTHDAICRRLCRDAGALVIAIDYRLAPEHRFPAAVEDVFAVFDILAPKAASLGADPARLWAIGDSAGGTLAAVLARRVAAGEAAAGAGLAGQILLYPVTTWVDTYPSHEECAENFPLPKASMAYFERYFFANAADKASPLASPGHYPPTTPQPPALILSAGLDVLRDEAAAYAAALTAAGTPVRYHCYEGVGHSFLDKGRHLPVAFDAVAEIAAAVRDGINPD